MKEISKQGAQGDVLFRRVDKMPEGAKPVERKGPIVVAHSETGHNHVIRGAGVKMFTTEDPLVCYLRLEVPFVDVEHQRPYDTHETLRLLGADDGPTVIEVRRQREHGPEGWRRVED